MLSLMKKDFVAENYDEEVLCNRIEQIQKSEYVNKFIKEIESVVDKDIKVFANRIKKTESAIRTFRLTGYESIDQMYDLLGFLFVVEKEEDIEKLVKKLKKKIKNDNFETINLLKEKPYKAIISGENNIENKSYRELVKNSFNELIYMPSDLKLILPPFSYNLLIKKTFKDLDFYVPIEIRIQTKEEFITTESYYYTIHKNDTLPMNIKIPLIIIGFRILKRMTEIEFITDIKNKEEKIKELQEIINDNKEFIENNKDIINMIIKENKEIIDCWKNKKPIYEFKIYN